MRKRTLHTLCVLLTICLGHIQIGYANDANDTPKTYSITVEKLTTDFKNVLLEDLPQIEINGFQQVKEAGSYLVKLRFTEGLIEEQSKQKKTSMGHPYMQVSYRSPAYTLNVLTEKGKLLLKKKYGGEKKTMDWGKERKFNDAAQLKVSWRQAIKTLWKDKEVNSVDLKKVEKDLQTFFNTIEPAASNTSTITKAEASKTQKIPNHKTKKVETPKEKNTDKNIVSKSPSKSTLASKTLDTPKKVKKLDPFAPPSEIAKYETKSDKVVEEKSEKSTVSTPKKKIDTPQTNIKIAKVETSPKTVSIVKKTEKTSAKVVKTEIKTTTKKETTTPEKVRGLLTKNIKADKSSLLEIANKYPMQKFSMPGTYKMKAGKKFLHHKTKAKSSAKKNNYRTSTLHALTALNVAVKKGQLKKSTELVNENYPKAISSSITELEKQKSIATVFNGDFSAFAQNKIVNIYSELNRLNEAYAEISIEKKGSLYEDKHDYKDLLEEAINDREAVCELLSKSHFTKAKEEALIAKNRKDYLSIARRLQHANYFHGSEELTALRNEFNPKAQMRLGYGGMLNYTEAYYPEGKFINSLIPAVATSLQKKRLPYFQKGLNPSIAGANAVLVVSVESVTFDRDKIVGEPQKREKTVKKVKYYGTYTQYTQESTARLYGSYIIKDLETGEILMEGSISDSFYWSHHWGRATGSRLALSKSEVKSLSKGPTNYPTGEYMKNGTASQLASLVRKHIETLAGKHGTYSGQWMNEIKRHSTPLHNFDPSQAIPKSNIPAPQTNNNEVAAYNDGQPTLGQMLNQYQNQAAAAGVPSNFNTGSTPKSGFDDTNTSSSYSSSGTVYGSAAEERLNEKINIESHTLALHKLIKKKAEKLNRFDLIMTEDVGKTIAREASQRKKVVLLPLLYQGKTDLSAYDSYFAQAKEKGIDQFMLVNIQTMTAFPVSERNINVSNTFVGFEGKVSYRIDYYDALTRELLHSIKVADSNVGNAGGAKVLTDGLGLLLGANKNERSEMKDLVNAVQEKTKAAALTKAFKQSSNKLDKHWEKQFPLYFDITNVALDAKGKHLLFTVNGGEEIGLVNAQILSVIRLGEDGKETEIANVFIKELLPTESKCQANKKIAESLKATFEKGIKLKAKVDVQKVNTLQSGLQGGKKLFKN